jgi:hypothetical protein
LRKQCTLTLIVRFDDSVAFMHPGLSLARKSMSEFSLTQTPDLAASSSESSILIGRHSLGRASAARPAGTAAPGAAFPGRALNPAGPDSKLLGRKNGPQAGESRAQRLSL